MGDGIFGQGQGQSFFDEGDVSTVPPPPVGRPEGGTAPDWGLTPVTVPHTRNPDYPWPGHTLTPQPNTPEGWWASQSTVTKTVVGVGALLAVGLIGWMVWSGSGSYKANRPSARTRLPQRSSSKGKIRTVKGGRRFGHTIPPKRYLALGAKHPEDYAWPEGFKYPLVFHSPSGTVNVPRTKAHIRAARSYFGRSKYLYTPEIRRTIAARINKASQRYKVGTTKVKV